MALNNNGLNAAAKGVSDSAPYLSLHSASPDATGSNETSAARQAVTWVAGAAGVRQLSAAANFTGGAANGNCGWAGLWSASTGGTYYGSIALTGDTTFNAAGQYTVSAGSVTIA